MDLDRGAGNGQAGCGSGRWGKLVWLVGLLGLVGLRERGTGRWGKLTDQKKEERDRRERQGEEEEEG